MKAVKIYAILFVAALAFSSCDDETSVTPDAPDGIIEDQEDVDLVVSDLKGEITGDITLAANQQWILTGPLVVSAGAKLTIEAGTTIKATAGSTDVYIAVERDGDIEAIGTAAAPITLTSNATAPAAGDWGGLLIMGKGKLSGPAGTSAVTEVVDFIYGGDDDTDNSGTLKYLAIKYTGARINGEKEFNGLTLYGVGSGTVISDIAILNGDDDAIEFFGGAVNVSNLLVVNATDDMFDWTQGYIGTGTNFYGIREANYIDVTADPRGFEGDGNLDGLSPTAGRQSNPTFTNVTIVSNSTAVITDVVKIRRNSGATLNNVLVQFGANAPAPGDFVDLSDGAGTAANTVAVTISGTGTNLNTADNNLAGTTATITVNTTSTGVASPATLFAWTGYSF